MKLYCQLLQENAGIKDIFIPKENVDDSYAFCYREPGGPPKNLIQAFIHIHVMYMNNKRKYIFCRTGGIHYSIFAKEKYTQLKSMLINIFTMEEDRNKILDIFSKTQRTVLALHKFVHLYRYKKAPVKITIDLGLNEIRPEQKHVFVLFQQKFKYYFTTSDLVNIINRCFMNSSHFFPEPLIPKNPYNNVGMTHADFYNIYFFIRSRVSIVPPLIQSMFLCNLDYEKFKVDCEPLIRESYIDNYVFTNCYSTLYPSIDMMFLVCKEWTRYLKISEDFPKDKLVNIMRPYLHLYYLHLYYIEGTVKKEDSYSLLKKRLRWFVKYNPYFGRKTVRMSENRVNEISFNEDCIDFKKNYVESEFKKINITLRDPFDTRRTDRTAYFSNSSTPEQVNRIRRLEPQHSNNSGITNLFEPRTPYGSPPMTPPMMSQITPFATSLTSSFARSMPQNELSTIPSLLFRSSLHSTVNVYDYEPENSNYTYNPNSPLYNEETNDGYEDTEVENDNEDTYEEYENEETEEDDNGSF